MTNDFAKTLRIAVITAQSDALALHAVAEEIRQALDPVQAESYLGPWETDLEKHQLAALAGYLDRASRFIDLGSVLLDAGGRDEAWALLATAARTVDAMLDIHEDTDTGGWAEESQQQLHELTRTTDRGLPAVIEPVGVAATVDGPIAEVTTLSDLRLQRTPEVFLDEDDLDARFTQNAWDLLTIAQHHIAQHLMAWNGVDTVQSILDGLHQARAERDAAFPSAA